MKSLIRLGGTVSGFAVCASLIAGATKLAHYELNKRIDSIPDNHPIGDPPSPSWGNLYFEFHSKYILLGSDVMEYISGLDISKLSFIY